MHVPDLMEAVRLVGVDEVYLVMRVDPEAEVADLLPMIFGKRAVPSVSFVVIEAIPHCKQPKWGPD